MRSFNSAQRVSARRHGQVARAARRSPALMESVEARQLFASGPDLVGVGFTVSPSNPGPGHGQVTVTFSIKNQAVGGVGADVGSFEVTFGFGDSSAWGRSGTVTVPGIKNGATYTGTYMMGVGPEINAPYSNRVYIDMQLD